jgi:hypothetical protein
MVDVRTHISICEERESEKREKEREREREGGRLD